MNYQFNFGRTLPLVALLLTWCSGAMAQSTQATPHFFSDSFVVFLIIAIAVSSRIIANSTQR